MVLLSTRNLPLATAYNKTAPEWIGPYPVIEAFHDTENYKLQLPEDLDNIYPTFHVELLKKYIPNDDEKFPGRKNTEPGPLPEFKDDERFEVEKIMASKSNPKTGTILYKVKWLGWDARHNTWEPAENIDQDAIDDFNERTRGSIPNKTTTKKTR